MSNENFDYVLNEFGGGFTENAFKDLIKVKRFTNRDLKLIDLNADFFNSLETSQIKLINTTNYIPIYESYFNMNENNYNSFNLISIT